MFEKPACPRAVRLSFAGITDGISTTIFVVEAGEAVDWTKPDDLDFSPGSPLPALGPGGRATRCWCSWGTGALGCPEAMPESTWRC